MTMQNITVSLNDRSYDIIIGSGILDKGSTYITPLLAIPHVIIVSDETIAPLYLEQLTDSLKDSGVQCDSIIMPTGEETKSFKYLEFLVDQIINSGVERATTLIALGGGVIGDLTGFAASIILRGLQFIQIPTTLLAQIDSSVGGKTGINLARGKNLIGSFHQPRLVLIDTKILLSLSQRLLRAGYAEIVKYALINNGDFFSWLEKNGHLILAGDREAVHHAISVSCCSKAEIVSKDETETGQRALLNLGHTFGHAFEAEASYNDGLLHGEAVSLGMGLAFELSVNLGYCPIEDFKLVLKHLQKHKLPTQAIQLPFKNASAESLIAHMEKDKKVEKGKINFILVRGIGKAFISDNVPINEVIKLLNNFLHNNVAHNE